MLLFSKNRLLANVCENRFFQFVKEFWSEISHEQPVWNWHIEYLCDEIQLVAERIFRKERALYDLVINISPGTTKSSIISVLLPVWCWTRMPSFRSICGSYTHLLALDLSRKSRDVFRSEKYQEFWPHLGIRDDQNTKGYFANLQGGMRYAVGVCGSVTGMHAHLLLPDDPIDPLQALSEADLKTAHHWMEQVLPTRKVDKQVSAMILVMQRLHEDDPTGRLLGMKNRPVKHICLPAELTEDVKPVELRERYVDGLFDQVRMPKDILHQARLTLGEYGYAAQFLQRPAPIGGGLFKETYFVHRVKSAPYKANRIRYWDLASTVGDSACNTAGTLLSRDERGDWFVENVVVGKWEPRERLENIKAVAIRDRTRYGPHNEPDIVLEHEGGSSGIDAFKYSASYLAGFKVYPDRPSGNKEDRARPVAAQCAAGNVFLVDDGCFVKGTKITTKRGNVSIEEITTSDYVFTRFGWRKVLKAWMTKLEKNLITVQFSNGATLTGTRNHRIWTENRGWIALDDCTWYDRVIICDTLSGGAIWGYVDQNQRKPQNMLNSMEFNTFVEKDISISQDMFQNYAEENASIGLFGDITTEKYLRDATFTTKTVIPKIMTSAISNVLLDKNTLRGTQIGENGRGRKHTSIVLEKKQQHGMGRLKEEYLVVKPEKRIGRKRNLESMYVNSVVSPLSQKALLLNTAQSNVRSGFGTRKVDTERQLSVRDVKNCAVRPIRKQYIVVEDAQQELGIPVYDLEVEDAHEFYANGILVHNSWDIPAWIKELVSFPNARLKDRVDSFSGAFNRLLARPQAGTLRVYSYGKPAKGSLRIIVASKEQLDCMIVEEPTILLHLHNPGCEPELPPTGLGKVLDRLDLAFGDIAPEDYQDRWDQKIDPYGLTPPELLLQRDQCKKLWHFLTRQRTQPYHLVTICDTWYNRGTSIALAYCKVTNWSNTIIERIGEDSVIKEPAANKYVFDQVVSTRGLVI